MLRKTLIIAMVTSVVMSMGGVLAAIGGELGDKDLKRFKVFEPVKPLLPDNIKIDETFQEGEGPSVGEVQQLSGKVYVVHRGKTVAYQLKEGFFLFDGDTLVTSKRSRVNAVMQDRSLFAMAPNTKVVIDKSYYREEKKERSTTMGLLFGQVRFLVKKLGTKPNFEVRTPTAVVGVRGSDFAMVVGPIEEEVQSSLDRILGFFNPVPKAHAFEPFLLGTTVLTGAGTSVNFSGLIGTTQIIGPYSISLAVTGEAARNALRVTVSLATTTLDTVGPILATMAMPPGIDDLAD